MIKLVENERSWAIELISEINSYLSQVNLKIKKAGGETTINNHKNFSSTDRKVMFPDILLYSDRDKNNILQGWEIKLPDVPVHNEEYIKDAQDKANKLGLNSTVLWNFRDIVLYVKDDKGWSIKKQWHDLNNINSREDVKTREDLWKNFLKIFLNELSYFHEEGTIRNRSLIEVSNNIVVYLVEDNKNYLATHLRELSKSDRLIDIYINKWWKNAKEEYMKDETDAYIAYAKNILLNWIIRFTFANIISITHIDALEIKKIKPNINPKEVNDIFNKITKTSDFYTIFLSQKYNDKIPNIIWEKLIDFNSFLNDKVINHEMMQKMLENSVSQYKREIIGQFTTPEKLVLLLLHSTIINLKGNDIDPCCGTGIIVKELMNIKRKNGISEREIHEKTWASDKMSFPLQIANMAMTTDTSMNLINKVFRSNVFELNKDTKIKLTSPKDGQKIEYSLPKFTNIVSNLPFVSLSNIETSEKDYIDNIESFINEESQGEIRFSRRSDFYFYIITYLDNILDKNGRIGVITSNSWLGTEAGKTLYDLLINYYKLESIIVSGNKKWFPNANVMSSIIVLEKKETKYVYQDTEIQLITLNESLDSLSNEEVIDIGQSILIGDCNKFISRDSYSIKDIDRYINSYNVSLNSLFYNIRWLEDIEEKVVPISEGFKIIRGMRRGWDPLFYPEGNHNIEPLYLEKVLKTSRDIKGYDTTAKSEAFCCSETIVELENLGHNGALNWIKKFENATNTVGKPLIEVLGTSKMKWYEMKSEGSMAEIVTSVNPGSRLFWAKVDVPSFINQRLIGISRKDNYMKFDISLLHALLNSIIGQFYIEATGFGRGLGALDLNSENIAKIQILNPELLKEDQKEEIVEEFNKLKLRNVTDTIEEINDPQKETFDKVVLSAFGIDTHYESIKESLNRMISARLSVRD